MAKINYDAINFKNKDVDKFTTKFGQGDPVKGQGPQKRDYGKEMMTFQTPSSPSVNIRKTNISSAKDNTSVQTAPKPTGPSKPSRSHAAAQQDIQWQREADKARAETAKKKAAEKAAEEKRTKDYNDALKKEEKARAERRRLHTNI